MNAGELLKHFDRLVAAPGSIDRLRQFGIDLALAGRLAEQDGSDEPVATLLERMGVESGSAVRPGLVDSPTLKLPTSWSWTTLGSFVKHSESGWSPKTLDQQRTGNEWGVLKVSAVSWNQFRPEENKQILPGTKPRLQAQVHRGDFLISRANTAELVARAVIVKDDPVNLMMSDKIVRLVLVDSCDPKYLWLVNNFAGFAREHYVRRASGVSPSMKNVTRDAILALPVPLPPLAEQRRIVAKVDELMSLCEQLAQSLGASERLRSKLLKALLHRTLQTTGVVEPST